MGFPREHQRIKNMIYHQSIGKSQFEFNAFEHLWTISSIFAHGFAENDLMISYVGPALQIDVGFVGPQISPLGTPIRFCIGLSTGTPPNHRCDFPYWSLKHAKTSLFVLEWRLLPPCWDNRTDCGCRPMQTRIFCRICHNIPRISWNQHFSANLWKITDTQAASGTLSAMEAAEAALVAAAAARQAEDGRGPWMAMAKEKDIRYIKRYIYSIYRVYR